MAVTSKSRRSNESRATTAKPLKVLSLSSAGRMGGAERSLLEVARAIDRERIDLQVVAPPGSNLAKALKASGIVVHERMLFRVRKTLNPVTLYSQLQSMIKEAKEFGKFCREEKFDIIHANTKPAAMFAQEVSRASKIPYVWHCRDIDGLLIAPYLARNAATVVAISAAVEKTLIRRGIRARRITRIDNGIDLSRFEGIEQSRSKVRRQLGIKPSQPVLIEIGGFVPWKRHEDFLETLTLVRNKLPNVVGLLVGSDLFEQNAEYATSLRTRARDLSLRDEHLRWLGERDDVPQLLSASDVLVSCSDDEPFGRVLAEAGAAAVPVVSTDSGGKREIVEDGVTGILTKRRNPEKLAEACVKLLGDERLRKKMGAAARKRIELLFDVRRTANELSSLLEGVVHGS